jgi:PAS domain S-box-containing protein
VASELELPRTSRDVPASRVSDAVLRCLFEESIDGLLIVDGTGKVLEVNAKFMELTGFGRAELLSEPTRCLLVESESPPQLVRVGGRLLFEHHVRCKDGSSFPAEIECRRLADGSSLAIVREKSEACRSQATIRDLTRLYALLSHVNQAVVRSRQRQDLFQSVCDAAVEHGDFRLAWIGVVDPLDGRVRAVAHAGQPADYLLGLDITQAEGVLGAGPVGRALRDGGVCVTDDVRTDPRLAPWREAALAQGFATIASVALQEGGQSVAALTVYERRAGFFSAAYRRLFEELGADISAALSFMEAQADKERAISERMRAEAEREQLRAELAHTQQLESIGRMAGVVAHDFNNMLTVISTCAEVCLADRRTHPQLAGLLREIREAASRSTGLARQLLTFARKQPVTGQRMDLNRLVEGSLALLRRMVGERLELVWRPNKEACPVQMDPGQLGQILSNLCVNARDAIAGTGRVTFETAHCTFDSTYCAQHPSVSLGDYVCLSVRDTGAGMDAEVQAHIFEPFFTTKCPGQGTGLGLSTVYGIVKQAGGFIQVDSAPLRGAEFKIYLPRLSQEVLK